MLSQYIGLIIVLMILAIIGLVRWFFYPSRELDVEIYNEDEQPTRASYGTHRAAGEFELEALNWMTPQEKARRLNLLREMGYRVITRPPEGVEFKDGRYQAKLPTKDELRSEDANQGE